MLTSRVEPNGEGETGGEEEVGEREGDEGSRVERLTASKASEQFRPSRSNRNEKEKRTLVPGACQ